MGEIISEVEKVKRRVGFFSSVFAAWDVNIVFREDDTGALMEFMDELEAILEKILHKLEKNQKSDN